MIDKLISADFYGKTILPSTIKTAPEGHGASPFCHRREAICNMNVNTLHCSRYDINTQHPASKLIT